MRVRVWLFITLAAVSLHAQTRTYSGSFSSRWKTIGKHGHDQPWCAEPTWTVFPNAVMVHGVDCNPIDFERANLDNSIGFRIGRERDFLSLRPLKIVGGVEGSVGFTEFNLSQADLALFDGSAFAGVDATLGGVRAGIRYGGGPWVTSFGRVGVQSFREFVASVPLRGGTSLRMARRDVNRRGVRATETSVLLTGTGTGDSRWEFASTDGVTNPGSGFGASLGLASTQYHRMSVLRELRVPRLQAYFEWTATAHESTLPGVYKGFPFNFRSKTINSFGAGLRHSRPLTESLSLRYGGGFEVADWRDDYDLLVRRSGTRVPGGVEVAAAASGAIRYRLGRGIALEGSLEQLWWSGIRLGERRYGVGLVFTR